MTFIRSIISFLVLQFCFSAAAQEIEIVTKHQKISTGELWFEYRKPFGKNEFPTIVFESGALSNSNYWNPVIDSISTFANTIRYDRAGLGRSLPPLDSIRSAVQIANELNELLDSLKVKNKIILVCHSAGGFYGRAFSHLYSQKVLALILIESPCTNWEDLLRSCLSENQNKERDSILNSNRSEMSKFERKEYEASEINRNFLEQLPQLKVPVFVIHGINHNWPEIYNGNLLNEKWQECQESLLSISENNHLIKIPNAGHHVFRGFNLPEFIYENLINQ